MLQASSERCAVIYTRVSSREQVEEGNSLVTQERLCQEYALKNGYSVSQVFVEQGESAKTSDRTELQRLLAYCSIRKNGVKAIIAYRIDRISRNTDDYSQIRLLLKRYGVEIKSVSEFFENTPAGRFMENIIANVAQFDNDVRAERCIAGMKEAVLEGRYVWTAPYGYSNCRIAGKANICPNEKAPSVLKAFEMVAANLRPTDHVRQLLGDELMGKRGKRLSKSQFFDMLRNKIYAGYILKFGQQFPGVFTPIVTGDLFEQVQRVLKQRKFNSKEYLIEHPDFPLRRFIVGIDDRKLRGAWAKGSTKRYSYYRFAGKGKQFPTENLEKQFCKFLDKFALSDTYYSWLRKFASDFLDKSQEDRNTQAKKIESQIGVLREKENLLISKNLSGIVPDNVLTEQLAQIEKERMNYYTAYHSLPDKKGSYVATLESVKSFLQFPARTWQKASFKEKLRIQKLIFPEGLIFDGKKLSTSQVSFFFNLKNTFWADGFAGVDSGLLEINHMKVTSPDFIAVASQITKNLEEIKGVIL